MAPGARSKFGAPMFEPEVFGSKCTVLRKVLVTLLGLFGAPHSDSAPGELCSPYLPRYAPVYNILSCLEVVQCKVKTTSCYQNAQPLGHFVKFNIKSLKLPGLKYDHTFRLFSFNKSTLRSIFFCVEWS